MKKHLFFLLLYFLAAAPRLQGQDLNKMLRLYDDNDGLNIRFLPTDQAYTNGFRLDLFYTKDHRDHFFLDRWAPKAGKESVQTYGWSATQLMFTPDSLTDYDYRPDDYAYSAALYATHSVYAFNPVKHYAIFSELILGVRGPAAGGEASQRFIHHLFRFERPHGWSHQLENKFLVNLNMRFEKQLAQWGAHVELSGGTQASAGTMFSGLSLYPLLRIGKMHNYYNGYIQQFSDVRPPKSRHPRVLQAYIVFRPEVQWVINNSLLDGQLKAQDPEDEYKTLIVDRPRAGIRKLVYGLNYGGVISLGAFGLSYMQNTSTALLKHGYSHEYGNISIYYSFR